MKLRALLSFFFIVTSSVLGDPVTTQELQSGRSMIAGIDTKEVTVAKKKTYNKKKKRCKKKKPGKKKRPGKKKKQCKSEKPNKSGTPSKNKPDKKKKRKKKRKKPTSSPNISPTGPTPTSSPIISPTGPTSEEPTSTPTSEAPTAAPTYLEHTRQSQLDQYWIDPQGLQSNVVFLSLSRKVRVTTTNGNWVANMYVADAQNLPTYSELILVVDSQYAVTLHWPVGQSQVVASGTSFTIQRNVNGAWAPV